MALRTADLDYELPPDRIAHQPASRRDESRLMVLDRQTGAVRHHVFSDLPGLLPARSLMVVNDTKVLPARLELRRRTGGAVHALFLHEPKPGVWSLMTTGSARLKPGERLALGGAGQELELIDRLGPGTWSARPVPGGPVHELLHRYGSAPLPPYIARDRQVAEVQREADMDRYQTIYARQPGAVAAPTAGLHFTPELMQRLETAGIERTCVTLHVGVGTFAPIRVEDLADHDMHAEWYECSESAAAAVNRARESGRPIVAVGTTSVRVLETCADENGRISAGSGWTRIFIYPPYRYRVIDHLITNFHLPGSTLLALVFAMAGRENVLNAYAEAIRNGYRFYSYGDAMLV